MHIMKQLFFAMLMLLPLTASAQLKAPSSIKADTLIVVACNYDGTSVGMEDWPAKYFVETPEKISIAGQNYIKNKYTDSKIHEYNLSWNGYVNYYSWGNATVNGKKANVYRVEPSEGCDNYPAIKYGIDDYSIYAIRMSYIKPFLPKIVESVKEKLLEEESPESVDEKISKLFDGDFDKKLIWYQYFAMEIFANSPSE